MSNKKKSTKRGVNNYPHPFIDIKREKTNLSIDFYDRKDKNRYAGNAMPTLRAFVQKMGIKADDLL